MTSSSYLPSPHILIADDEPSVCLILERTLLRQGYKLEVATDGETALRVLRQNHFDLILLDLNLGDMSGLSLLKAARQQDEDVVVIILTGQGSLQSAVEALRLGAFDYLFKPAFPEAIRQRVNEGLKQRQQALQRRQIMSQIEQLRQALTQLTPLSGSGVVEANDGRFLRTGPLVVDRHHRVVTFNNALLDLTSTEFDLLVCLIESAPEALAPRHLLNCALNYDGDDLEARDTIKWYIHHLRRKLEPDPKKPIYIKTVRHKGYLWVGEQES
jgi:DNA-binding response OmpR family regulator